MEANGTRMVAPVAVVGQPLMVGQAGGAYILPEEDGTLVYYKKRTQQIACAGIWVPVCLGVVFASAIFGVALSVPSHMSLEEFRYQCARGERDEQLCKFVEKASLKKCEELQLNQQGCTEWLEHHTTKKMQEAVFGFGMLVLIMALCQTIVPCCGYFGAKGESNSTMLGFFIFLTGFGSVYGICELVRGDISLPEIVVQVLFPGLCFYYSLSLWQRRAELATHFPQVAYMQQPPETQGVRLQPGQAQGGYVPPQAYMPPPSAPSV